VQNARVGNSFSSGVRGTSRVCFAEKGMQFYCNQSRSRDGMPQCRARQSTLRSEKRIADVPVITVPTSPFNIFRDCEQL